MTGDGMVDIVWYMAALVLVGSSLLARRLEAPRAITLAVIWIAIFATSAFVISRFT